MTTFQDPQPQSRRAVRQSERGQNDPELGVESSGFTQFPPTSAPAAPQFIAEPEAPRETWDTAARRAAQLPPATPASNTPPAASGRRSAAPVQPAGEPLTYSTQSSVPSFDGPSFRSRTAPPAAPADDLAPTQAIPKAEQPAYRVRDFSPEGRRSTPTPQPTWNPSPAPVAAAPAVPLEYQTEARIAAPAAPPAPVAEVPPSLTRRELRAQQAADAPPVEAAPAAAPAAVAPAVAEPAAAAPAVAAPAAAAPVEAPAPVEVPALVEPEPAAATDEPQAWPFGNLFPDPNPTEVVSEPIAPVAAVIASQAPEPTTNTALTNAIAEFDSLTQEPAVEQPAREVDETPTSQWTAPIGHWSTQMDLDDETQPFESTINRTVGSGSATTSALVLPAIPEGSDIRGPLTGTGEIMLTGSIDLPHAYSSTGASSRVEHHGIDALFDLHDAEVVPTDSQPVRAISAVSTHNSGQGVTHTQKPKGTRALTALVISAASMAVVVVGLLVAVFALNIF